MSLSIEKLNKVLSGAQRFTYSTQDMIHEQVIKDIKDADEV